MPSHQEITQGRLEEEWAKGNRLMKRKSGGYYLSFTQYDDNSNHIHIFQDDYHGWSYNIKCNNIEGNKRQAYRINEHQSISDLIKEMEANWYKDCKVYVDSMMNRGPVYNSQEYFDSLNVTQVQPAPVQDTTQLWLNHFANSGAVTADSNNVAKHFAQMWLRSSSDPTEVGVLTYLAQNGITNLETQTWMAHFARNKRLYGGKVRRTRKSKKVKSRKNKK